MKKKIISGCAILVLILIGVLVYNIRKPRPFNLYTYFQYIPACETINIGDYSVCLEQYSYAEAENIIAVRLRIINNESRTKKSKIITGDNYCLLSDMGLAFVAEENGAEQPKVKADIEKHYGCVFLYLEFKVQNDTFKNELYVLPESECKYENDGNAIHLDENKKADSYKLKKLSE